MRKTTFVYFAAVHKIVDSMDFGEIFLVSFKLSC